MGKLILVTGGARSGKSSFAETKAKECGGPDGRVLYIATSIPFDDEMRRRVALHRQSRPSSWGLLESWSGLGPAISRQSAEYPCMLLDCVTLMATNIMMDALSAGGADVENASYSEYMSAEPAVVAEIDGIIGAVRSSPVTLVAVTNEIGSGIVPENAFARAFRDIAGRAGQRLGAASDEAWLLACGLPVKLR